MKKISQNFLLFIEESLWDLFFQQGEPFTDIFYERKRQRPETEQFFMEPINENESPSCSRTSERSCENESDPTQYFR
mgnify:CR=1 FL=1